MSFIYKVALVSIMHKYVCVHVCVLVSWVVSNFLRPHRGACQVPLFMEFSKQEYWTG